MLPLENLLVICEVIYEPALKGEGWGWKYSLGIHHPKRVKERSYSEIAKGMNVEEESCLTDD